MYDLVLFDLDGTLINTIDGLARAVNHSLTKYDLNTRTVTEVQSFVGNGIRKLIERSVPAGTEETVINKVFDEFRSFYTEHCTEDLAEYTGIKELVKKLHKENVAMAVVTNKNHEAACKIVKDFFGENIDVVVGAHEDIPKKPSPDMIRAAYKLLHSKGKNTAKAIYVGDSEVDILTAENSGLDCISVSWGFKTREFLEEAGAKFIVDDAKELENAIFGLRSIASR